MRDDFSQGTKDLLAKQVNLRCSNPGCKQPTSGPQVDPAKAINVGVAAHITAASFGGPRYNPTLTSDERCSPENGIWLCQKCAKLIDNDEVHYDVDRVRNWKRGAIDAARRALEGGVVKESTPPLTYEDPALQFVEATGVWCDTKANLHVCPHCKSNGKRSYLKNEEHGFRCTACGQYYGDPARKPRPVLRASRSSYLGGGRDDWMR
jgi:hypothetical protein